jgi:hypothetical protein
MTESHFLHHPALDKVARIEQRVNELRNRWQKMPKLPYSELTNEQRRAELAVLLVISELEAARSNVLHALHSIKVATSSSQSARSKIIAHRVSRTIPTTR